MSERRKAFELALLDALESRKRERFAAPVWRVTREGRDPVMPSPSNSRWCDGSFDVLYTALAPDGAIAEVHALLAMQPVLPSRIKSFLNCLEAEAGNMLVINDLRDVESLGISAASYRDRDYGETQTVAAAAQFLGYDGIIAPSARWNCQNAIFFAGSIMPSAVKPELIDWDAWRKTTRAAAP